MTNSYASYSRSNTIRDLARMMIKQARLLKSAGLINEAKALARRAIALNHAGHTTDRMQPIAVRSKRL